MYLSTYTFKRLIPPEMPDPAMPSLYHCILPLQLLHIWVLKDVVRQDAANVCQFLIAKILNHLIHELSVSETIFFPNFQYSESHCVTADGGETDYEALVQLFHSTSQQNIIIRWSFKISIYFISWHPCIVGARQYTLSQQYHIPKVQTYLLRLWISYRFY